MLRRLRGQILRFNAGGLGAIPPGHAPAHVEIWRQGLAAYHGIPFLIRVTLDGRVMRYGGPKALLDSLDCNSADIQHVANADSRATGDGERSRSVRRKQGDSGACSRKSRGRVCLLPVLC